MKVIDKLSALDMFGDAVVGLVLLFPDDFDWFLGVSLAVRLTT